MIQKKTISIFIALLFALLAALIFFIFSLKSQIETRLEQGWFLPPVEVYAAPNSILKSNSYSRAEIDSMLKESQFRLRNSEQTLRSGDFNWGSDEFCNQQFTSSHCLQLRHSELGYHLILFDKNYEVLNIYSQKQDDMIDRLDLKPELFAQFYDGKPILRNFTPISETPLYCLQAVTAIEDSGFLDHKGVSPLGIARAAVKNLLSGRVAQGGSTITQQLVKNYFLTPERTFKRKFIEMFMSIILEAQVDKDQILEAYLNVIYMGQNGPFQVRGFGAASQFYFDKSLSQLNLEECALLAAIINSPGRYNPFRKPENALSRRNKVLSDMFTNQMINADRKNKAQTQPLPKNKKTELIEPAPYYVDAVYSELEKLGIDQNNGLKVYTQLNTFSQNQAQDSLENGLNQLESQWKSLKDKAKEGKVLQGLLISANLKTGGITALVGGRNFKKSQYNRAIDSRRQIGSIMKPFTYLAAMESLNENGQPYTPLSSIEDKTFTYEYEGQSWSPENYSKTQLGPVPLFYALKNSMNIPTAKLGISIGLSSVIDVAKRMGIESELKPYPSITLGAFEVGAMEVLQAYLNLGRMGNSKKTHIIKKVTNLEDQLIYHFKNQSEQLVSSQNAAVILGILKNTVDNGTGQLARRLGFSRPAAGKTGTTSDFKDAWFVGLTPQYITVVWVGYDDNTPHGLTGASGALPIWTEFMKAQHRSLPVKDFIWPEGVELLEVEAKSELPEVVLDKEPESFNLIFKQ
ncbi:MAG: PBP1A family penicillin-binding protein [Bdellovibrionales bacterium]|nr:PBP1A family penicillin-binding protein [Bdellovibrionales bacterium]